jgi:HEAT repeat protein
MKGFGPASYEWTEIRVRLQALVAVALASLIAACRSAPEEPSSYKVEVDVTQWIRALGSDDLFESEPAIDGLAALGSNAIPALEAAFAREDASTRRGVVEVLQQIDSAETVRLILRAVQDPDEEVRMEGLQALATSGDERAGPIIERALHDPNPAVYRTAIDACAAVCRSPDALRRIVELAIRDQPFVGISTPRHTLRYILHQEDEQRAQAARDAITNVAFPLLQSPNDRQLRLRAALLVADLSSAAAIPALRDALSRPIKGVPPRVDAQMRAQAIAALGQIDDRESVAILRKNVKRGEPFRTAACRALDQLARRGVEGAAAEAQRCAPATSTGGR